MRAYFGEVKSKIIALLCVVQCEGVEICLLSGADNLEEVKFAVRLVDLDLSKQVPGCVLRQQQQIFLQVIFPVRKRRPALPSAPHIKLVSSTSLKDLFDVEEMKLPIWVDGMCMAEYIPTLEENLKAQLSEAITSVNLRRAFIEALVPHFGRPLEAETVFCRRVSALAATGPFTFLHFDSQGMPITSRSYSDYPWSPRWDVAQMTQRIYEFVVDECINFKQYCSDALQFHR